MNLFVKQVKSLMLYAQSTSSYIRANCKPNQKTKQQKNTHNFMFLVCSKSVLCNLKHAIKKSQG